MTTQIHVQPTPNPNALKFILEKNVKNSGNATFNEFGAAQGIPLAEALLVIQHVSQLYFFENVISVTQNGLGEWDAIEENVKKEINAHLDNHDPEFTTSAENQEAQRDTLPPEIQEIEAILDRTIRPGLQGDGGDLEVVSLDKETNSLMVRYQGACGSCPSSTAGTLMAIQGILQDEYDPKIEVVAV